MMRIPTFGQFMHQAGYISKEFDKMGQLMQQAESGKRLLHSSDDPVLANQINSKRDYINTIQSYFDNGIIAQSRSTIVNASAQSATNVLSQITTLLKQAQDGTKSDADRLAISKQLQGCLTNLNNLVNAQDANGQYVFSGSNPTTPAYIKVNGSYQYQGADQSSINIAPGISTIYGESGDHVFGNIFDGNGTFAVSASSTNTGSASVSPGSVIDSSSYVADTYTISFGTNASGKMVYQVVGSSSGQVLPPPPATFPNQAPVYQPGTDITFNGINLNMSGQPNVGDTFQVQPSTKKNVLNEIQDAITLLQTPVSNKGQFSTAIDQMAATFNQITTHIASYQSEVGTRTSAINTQVTTNKTMMTNQTISLSGLENADLPTVYSAAYQQSLVLQATQESYLKMQDVLSKLLQLQF